MHAERWPLALALVACAGCSDGPVAHDPPPATPPALIAPTLRAPRDGARTGSAQVAPSASIARHPLRPRFVWSAVPGAEVYELQVDDSCDPGSYRGCELPSLELEVRAPGEAARGGALAFAPPRALEVSRVAPLGRRYYWRLRACAAERCGPWSAVRALEVGRLADDLDGDGYSDVAIGKPGHAVGRRAGAGEVLLYYGSASGTPQQCGEGARCARVPNPNPQAHGRFGASVAAAGDLNGDGFADLVIGAPGQDAIGEGEAPTAQEGNVFVYYGGPDGIDARCDPDASTGRCVRLDNPDDQLDGGFGHALARAGDVNGDGYDDIIVGAPFQHGALGGDPVYDGGAAFVYYGGPRGLATECEDAQRCARIDDQDPVLGRELGLTLGGGGDLDGDGYADVVVGSGRGVVTVYYGGERGIDSTCGGHARARCARIERSENRFGSVVAIAGDVDGDGYDELLVGAPRPPGRPAPFQGSVLVYRGSASGIASSCTPGAPGEGGGGERCLRLEHPDAATWTSAGRMEPGYLFFGTALAGAGDVNGDGYGDVVVGTYRRARLDSASVFGTDAVLFFGGAGGPMGGPCAPSRQCAPLRFVRSTFERSVDTCVPAIVDANGDGYGDLVLGTPLSTADPRAGESGEATIRYGGEGGAATECAPPEGDERPACAPLEDPAPQANGRFGAAAG